MTEEKARKIAVRHLDQMNEEQELVVDEPIYTKWYKRLVLKLLSWNTHYDRLITIEPEQFVQPDRIEKRINKRMLSETVWMYEHCYFFEYTTVLTQHYKEEDDVPWRYTLPIGEGTMLLIFKATGKVVELGTGALEAYTEEGRQNIDCNHQSYYRYVRE